jgi:soluble lytic murein transglycosylase-like protein
MTLLRLFLCVLAILVGALRPATADELVRRAATDASAALELALRLELGLGRAPDREAAAAQLCRAAAMGSPLAASHLAAALLDPDSPAYDPATAAAWLRYAQTRARLGEVDRATLAARRAAPSCPGGLVLPDAAMGLAELIAAMAIERGLDPVLVKAVITAESAWDANAVSRAGAQGLMQLMPGTGRLHGVGDAFDIRENLRGGMDHLAMLLRRFRGDETLALAAYNAGEGPVLACACVPPYPETTAYVRRVLQLAARRTDAPRAAPASRASSGATARAPAPRG